MSKQDMEDIKLFEEGELDYTDIALPEHDTRVEQNIYECSQGEDFDWDEYQYLCDISEGWNTEY